MENETFQLLIDNQEKILSEIKEIKQDLRYTKQELQHTKNIVTRMEHSHGEKLGALFDGYSANQELVECHEPRISGLESKVAAHDLQILALTSSK